jgi:hypothetical protein
MRSGSRMQQVDTTARVHFYTAHSHAGKNITHVPKFTSIVLENSRGQHFGLRISRIANLGQRVQNPAFLFN